MFELGQNGSGRQPYRMSGLPRTDAEAARREDSYGSNCDLADTAASGAKRTTSVRGRRGKRIQLSKARADAEVQHIAKTQLRVAPRESFEPMQQ